MVYDTLRRGGKARLSAALAWTTLGCLLAADSAGFAQTNSLPVDTTPPTPPPAVKGLVRLFSGNPEDIAANWVQNGKPAEWKWEDGAMVATRASISTREKYSDFQLHVEFRVPYLSDKKGQARGNSGVILQGRYEIQILDSYGIQEPGTGDCGAVYNQAAPLVNACKPPLQWQTYDIVFRAPRFDSSDHHMLQPPMVTVFQNGIVVQKDQEIHGLTHVTKPKKGAKPEDAAKQAPAIDFSTPGPITLQYHSNPVAFRNIWIVPLPLQGPTHYEPR
jgi:hypothetical protein